MTSRRSVYGDQGEEVAWQNKQEQCVARQEEVEEHQDAGEIRVGSSVELP